MSLRDYFRIVIVNACLFGMLSKTDVSLAQESRSYSLPNGKTSADIHPNQLLIKFKDGSYTSSGRTLTTATDINPSTLNQRFSVKEIKALEPASSATSGSRMAPSLYLTNLYRVEMEDGDVVQVINELLKYENVLYAEPVFKEQLFIAPNDPDAAATNSKQPYLASIKAYDAWGVTTGDSTVVIGIIDTGADYNHEDLESNIFLNTNDPIDGTDNDGNGYIDDYRGWDFADRDSDPASDFGNHGTRVAGLASARTNNAIGMAGTGFKSKFVPLKAFRSSNNTSGGNYEAIIYAADRGVDVLNLSWGSTGSYSQAAQDIINYAVLEKNVVVVAAAGNTNAELTFYPASYDNVLSVAASTNDGTKSSFGTYSHYVDLVAPGTAVYSTNNANAYGTADGSSFSSPLVAGAAALMKSYFPHYTAVQIIEQLRISGTSVDGLSGNAAFKGLLGRGMLNMYAALTDTLSPSVRIVANSFYTQTGQKVYYGDTVHYQLAATNWLKPATGLEIDLELVGDVATITNSKWATPYLAKDDSIKHSFSLVVNENVPPSSRVIVKAKMTASGYNDTQYFEFSTQPDSITTTSANLALTINSKGDLGYTQDSLKAGNGLRFLNSPIVSQAGFLIGTSDSTLADNVSNNLKYNTRSDDFSASKYLKLYSGTSADTYYENAFTASINNTQSVLVEQKTLSWNAALDADYLITEYRITNTSTDTLKNLHAGLFSNWNIGSNDNNRTIWVDSLKLGVTYIDDTNYYGGIALLSESSPTFYAADIDTFNGNIAVTDSLLSDSLKYAWLSSQIIKPTAGQNGAGNNTAQINGVNLGNLAGLRSEKIAFAWVAGATKNDLINAVKQARARYAEFKSAPRTVATVLACKDSPVTVHLASGKLFNFFGDAAGSDTLLLAGNDYVTEPISSTRQLFAQNADNPYLGDIFSIQINLDDLNANFSPEMDTILLESGDVPTLTFASESPKAVSWSWDFGNGSQSTLANPQTKFNNIGTYDIRLTTTSIVGCTASSSKTILVANRAPLPIVDSLAICNNTTATIQAQNASIIRVYADSLAASPVFEGSAFTSGQLAKDTSFYVANADSLFESRRLPVYVTISQPTVDFSYQADTASLNRSISLVNQSTNASSFEWYQNDILISEATSTNVLLGAETEMNITLKATNNLGCISSQSKTFTFSISPLPEISDAVVCPGEPFILAPGNGVNFLFSSGSTGAPLHKGPSYQLPEVSDTIRVVVQGVDNILESEPVEVMVYPYDLSAAFTVSPEVLILKNQKTATFSSLSESATTWEWLINGETIDISREPLLAFDSAGQYNITLIVANEQGCSDSASFVYQVLEVTGVEKESGFFILFPNPADKNITIKLPQSAGPSPRLSIFNLAGQELYTTVVSTTANTSPTIPVDFLPKGIYTVRLFDGAKSWQQRLIKQ